MYSFFRESSLCWFVWFMNKAIGRHFTLRNFRLTLHATYISAHFSCFTIFLASKSSEAAGRRRFARQKNGKT